MTVSLKTPPTQSKVSPDRFLVMLQQSQLLELADLDPLNEELRASLEAGNISTAEELADILVERKFVTRWQADKLLQGKHKSFQLGKYRLCGIVGRGGMSTVYLAQHTVMKRLCALKVLPAKRVKDASWLGRFHREAQVGASLDHPNIIRTFDVDQVMEGKAEVHFIVMEYVEGEDFKLMVERDGPLDQFTVADYIRQACDGLAHAHEADLVHRDIKPGNLLLDSVGTVRLLDLGLALASADDEESLTRAHNERVIGTADYLSPEQALDSHLVDPRADLYGLGCTMYFMLTGRPPFNDGSLAQRILAHQTRKPEPLADLVPGISEDLVRIIDRMLEKDADRRYQSASEVGAALTRWLAAYGSEEWRTAHRELVSNLPDAPEPAAAPTMMPGDEQIPMARPVIPRYEPIPASDSGAYDFSPSVVLNEDFATTNQDSHPNDDFFSNSAARRAGTRKAWLLPLAVAALLCIGVVVSVILYQQS